MFNIWIVESENLFYLIFNASIGIDKNVLLRGLNPLEKLDEVLDGLNLILRPLLERVPGQGLHGRFNVRAQDVLQPVVAGELVISEKNEINVS